MAQWGPSKKPAHSSAPKAVTPTKRMRVPWSLMKILVIFDSPPLGSESGGGPRAAALIPYREK